MNALVLSENQSASLAPGLYWIELAFDRAVDRETVLSALESMGFEHVVFDADTDPTGKLTRIGATFAPMRTTSTSTMPRVSATSLAMPVRVTAAPAPAPAAPKPPPNMGTSTQTAQQRVNNAFALPRSSAAFQSALAKGGTSVLAPKVTPTLASVRQANLPPDAKRMGKATKPVPGLQRLGSTAFERGTMPTLSQIKNNTFSMGPGRMGPGGDVSASPSGDGGGAGYDAGAPTGDGGGGGGGPGGGGDFSDASAAPPDEDAYVSYERAIGPNQVFGNYPETALTVDEIGRAVVPASPWTFRFVAELARPIIVSNGVGFWRMIKKLVSTPTSPPRWNFQPFVVEKGRWYEGRFVSRDRTARGRGDVETLLEAMGFHPAKLLVLKRNERVPGRPNVSVSEWLMLAQWAGPSSMITTEEPFWFLDLVPLEKDA